ncbi:MAG TPA: hypothetical protein VEP46_11810, partial [Vicinamibacterales bacterium]|nr:hypothetical protein [Vicinamibacterales bacterium]
QVDVGGLLASTLSMTADDFMAGRYSLRNAGSAASVVNQGSIKGRSVVLVGPRVVNEGTIEAQSGTIALTAANAATLDLMADGLVQIRVDQGTVAAEVANSGLLRADGGAVTLTAKSLDNLARSVVNHSGIIEARGVQNVGGVVRLLGDHVAVLDGARIDASGDTGGGQVLIGGNFQGRGPEMNATATYVAPTASIAANATARGDGGRVIVWSDEVTRSYGAISARGGPLGGDGGFVETSSHGSLLQSGAPDVSAPRGLAGMWLIDPTSVTVVSGNVSLITSGLFDPAISSNIGDADINAALITGNVTIQTNTAGSGGNGDIIINGTSDTGGAAAIASTGSLGRALTLNAAGSINMHSGASITSLLGPLGVTLNPVGSSTIAGSMDLKGGTLSYSGPLTLASSGTVANATVSGASVFTSNGGVLDSVTIGSSLTYAANSSSTIRNNLTIGSGLTLDLGNSTLYFSTNDSHLKASSGSATVNLAGGSLYGSAGGGAQNFTIDAGVTVQGYGTLSHYFGSPITNAGTIIANTSGQQFYIAADTFTNSGTLDVTAGTMYVAPTTFTN